MQDWKLCFPNITFDTGLKSSWKQNLCCVLIFTRELVFVAKVQKTQETCQNIKTDKKTRKETGEWIRAMNDLSQQHIQLSV